MVGEVETSKIRSFKNYTNFLEKLKIEFRNKFENNIPSSNSYLHEYEKLDVIGRGTYGIVMVYRHRHTGTFIACKRILKVNVIKKNLLQQVLHEKKIMYSTNFPFVINALFFCKDNEAIYYGMPFINGGDMLTLLKRKRKFSEEAARFFTAQVLLAIEYLHFIDIIHRDIKPENILVNGRGYIKLADLGLSKLTNNRLWSFCGTPEYVSPEIIQSKGYGKTVDWWSFGVLLYELSNGRSPFFRNRSDHLHMYNDIIEGKYVMPTAFSSDLRHLVFNLLQVDTTKRFGCLKNGSLDIKGHNWFKHTNWLGLFNQDLDAPIKPVIKSEGDTSNFEKIADESYKKSPICCYEEEFRDY